MTRSYRLKHHQNIIILLNNFNPLFLQKNNIFFGGETRIALELDEFRESIDIDLLCPTIDSYRAVRNTVCSNSLGQLVKKDFSYLRDISSDRYATRTFIDMLPKPIKLEIVSFEKYRLKGANGQLFPIPYLDQESCFYTKLLANADRLKTPPYKDIIDILFMIHHWGNIPISALRNAEIIYGNIIINSLTDAVEHIKQNKHKYIETCKHLSISEENIDIILNDAVVKLCMTLNLN